VMANPLSRLHWRYPIHTTVCREIMGIGTEFEAAKLPRHNARNVTDLHPDFGAIGDDLLFEDLELLQRKHKGNCPNRRPDRAPSRAPAGRESEL